MEAECIFRRAGAVRRSARGPIALRGWVAGILLAATLALFGPLLGARAQAERHDAYQGFSLTFHAGVGTEMESVAHVQIDEVLGVGLPADTIGFLKTVPLEVVEKTATSPGHYGNKRVEIDRTVLTQREKPILLHELMHALHDQRLPDGFANLEILTFFRRAQTLAAFAPRSHMMSNVREYFATTATTYLYGVTAQEPFSRSKIQDNQPIYFSYLARLFGPDAGHFEGRLH